MADQDYLTVDEIAERIRRRALAAEITSPVEMTRQISSSVRLDELRRSLRRATTLLNAVGEVTPRPPGLKNSLAQLAKKWIQASLMWVFRPLRQYNSALLMALNEATHAMETVEHGWVMLRERIEILEATVKREVDGAEKINPERTLNLNTADLPKEIAFIRQEMERLHAELAELLMDRSARRQSGQE